jgi:hypothetical protein
MNVEKLIKRFEDKAVNRNKHSYALGCLEAKIELLMMDLEILKKGLSNNGLELTAELVQEIIDRFFK